MKNPRSLTKNPYAILTILILIYEVALCAWFGVPRDTRTLDAYFFLGVANPAIFVFFGSIFIEEHRRRKSLLGKPRIHVWE